MTSHTPISRSMSRKPGRPSLPLRRPGVPRQNRNSMLAIMGKARASGPLISVAAPASRKASVSQTGAFVLIQPR